MKFRISFTILISLLLACPAVVGIAVPGTPPSTDGPGVADTGLQASALPNLSPTPVPESSPTSQKSSTLKPDPQGKKEKALGGSIQGSGASLKVPGFELSVSNVSEKLVWFLLALLILLSYFYLKRRKPPEPEAQKVKPPSSLDTPDTNADLAKAEEALLQDNPEKAIQLLEGLAQREPRYSEKLLTALTLSKNRRDWQKARNLLPKFGRPMHYLRLGYYSFQEDDLSSAAELTERGLLLAESSDRPEDQKTVIRLKHNLAYYYAALGRSESSERALQYAKEALKSRIDNGEGAEALTSSLDTLGFVQIVFARSPLDVEEGLKNVEEAGHLGGRSDMYLQHVELANKRLEELTRNDSQKDAKGA
ncbi:MAG: hypothetical protein WAM82_30410 [Thermoanaerobaculia bacterium]